MNNAKMWLVVKPTVGIPLFLVACAIASFLVHLMLVLTTGWMGDYYSGSFEAASLVSNATTLLS
ncbi:light-harvesting protein [Rhodovulum sulfidophilum]|uniref:Light-harvesting protein B-800/850 alpha chain n=1 Tax=Rhodovulum sulfidophilum TaxID=35806 RepID=LHA2_RHOSU|nr:light-harvesting protein [Rhodovulum sulfidophilum]P95655.1 RecName: Full=Light-harvesting protein B-800/850 alpha chain; AltName: Full=Antenna pigment protein alpha chain; AltName: Full=LH-2 [Rhodovulum sulfidophilum]AAB59007.1 peripheral light harvesting complex subunit alpha precursor [Rhodovulum sulfidophilum]ANB34277.1 light-harvesting protein [Rhodovulum sulfidophilum DSM 1374]ANB38100.1 light-harvesting protein [Rhodovulum sulfidophilum]MBK5924210.1 light-harvesting protein B-800/850